jgi:hypothetical protein
VKNAKNYFFVFRYAMYLSSRFKAGGGGDDDKKMSWPDHGLSAEMNLVCHPAGDIVKADINFTEDRGMILSRMQSTDVDVMDLDLPGNDDQEAAAAKIQNIYRDKTQEKKKKERKKKEQAAAVSIQRVGRGSASRRQVKQMKERALTFSTEIVKIITNVQTRMKVIVLPGQ